MDIKVSHKERRLQPSGFAEVLVDNVCDLRPIFAKPGEADSEWVIMDVEWLDDPAAEALDRAMFALVKQEGADPTEPGDGLPWSGAVLGDVLPTTILQRAYRAVAEEGPGVKATAYTVKGRLVFQVDLTGAA